MYVAAGATTVLALLILGGLKEVERRVFAHRRITRVTLRVRREPGQLDAIDAGVRASGLEVRRVQIETGRTADEQRVRLDVRGTGNAAVLALAERLQAIAGVRTVAYGTHVLTAADDGDDRADEPA